MITHAVQQVYASGPTETRVSVIIPLYNYQQYIVETLEAVRSQSFRDVTIVIVDDASTDLSLATVQAWADGAPDDLGVVIVANTQNVGLSRTRNAGIAHARARYCFFLDADNLLYPRCIEKHVAALDLDEDAAAAYGLIEAFGAERGIMGNNVFCRERLARGNYLDAMAMFRRETLIEFGGYRSIPYGWEDYDLWLRLCEADARVIQLPEILSRYRVHATSMLRQVTNQDGNIQTLQALMKGLHPWISIC